MEGDPIVQRHCALILPAVLIVLFTFGNTVNAGPVVWDYKWEATPLVIHSDPVIVPLGGGVPPGVVIDPPPPPLGDGTLMLHPGHIHHGMIGSSDVDPVHIRTHSGAPWWFPAHFTDATYSLKLWIEDEKSEKWGSVTFTGKFNGTLWEHGALIKNTFTGPLTQTLVLGDDLFTVTIGPYLPPGPPGRGDAGGIGAEVDVRRRCDPQVTPEPSALVLSSLGALCGVVWWRRRERPAT
jgi:hypothetical protein